MRYELLVGVRYLSATRNSRVPSLITLISVLAIAVGVAVMMLVFSVMGGFEADLRDKILAAKAHVLITGPARGNLEGAEEVLDRIRALPGVSGATPFVESELLLTSRTNYTGVIVRGIVPERIGETSRLPEEIIEGDLFWLNSPDEARVGVARPTDSSGFEESDADARIRALRESVEEVRTESERLRALLAEREGSAGVGVADREVRSPGPSHGRSTAMPALPAPGTTATAWRETLEGGGPPPSTIVPRQRSLPGIILGSELRTTLYVQVGDVVELVNPDGDIGPTGPIPAVHRFRVVGTFYSGLFEFDNRMAYAHVDEVRSLLSVPADEVTGIEVLLDDMDRARSTANRLRADLVAAGRSDTDVRDWTELNASLFGALMLEKVAMGLLLLVIVLVASFAVVCVLIMVVIQKRAEIAILRSMGATSRSVLLVFLAQGGALTFLGTLLGAVLGLGVIGWLAWVGVPLDPEVFYIDRVPVTVDPREVTAVITGTLLIGLLATIYPSVQAARLEPAEGLREE
jgi:lipoprotein-releasing system permease protein